MSEHKKKLGRENSTLEHDYVKSQLLGLVAVFVSCLTSGFAGVYFEFDLKSTEQSVYCRNFQLAFFSFMLAGLHILSTDSHKILDEGMFQGFDTWVILIVIMQGMAGFFVSMMIKYADTVWKAFATSIAAVLATVASAFLFNTSLDDVFLYGAGLVALAVRLYSVSGTNESTRLAFSSNRPTWCSGKRLKFLAVLLISAISCTTRLPVPPRMQNNFDNSVRAEHICSFSFHTGSILYCLTTATSSIPSIDYFTFF